MLVYSYEGQGVCKFKPFKRQKRTIYGRKGDVDLGMNFKAGDYLHPTTDL